MNTSRRNRHHKKRKASSGQDIPFRQISTAIFDEDRMFREVVLSVLSSVSEIRCEGSGSCFDPCLSIEPDVILIHCRTPMIPRIRELVRRLRASRFVAIRVDPERLDLVSCIRAGVVGFLSYDANRSDLISAIRSLARGEVVLPSRLAATLFEQLRCDTDSTPTTMPYGSLLTAREEQVAEMVVEGLSNKQIARRLSIELSTVKTHVHNVLQKLNAPSRAVLISRQHSRSK